MTKQHNGISRIVPGRLGVAKQIVYRFNGDPKYDRVISDATGYLPFRRVGDILTKKGKQWRVTIIRNDFNMDASRSAVPIHRVFVTDNF